MRFGALQTLRCAQILSTSRMKVGLLPIVPATIRCSGDAVHRASTIYIGFSVVGSSLGSGQVMYPYPGRSSNQPRGAQNHVNRRLHILLVRRFSTGAPACVELCASGMTTQYVPLETQPSTADSDFNFQKERLSTHHGRTHHRFLASAF